MEHRLGAECHLIFYGPQDMYTAMLSPRSVVYRCWGLNYLSRIIDLEVHYTFVTKVIGGPGGGGGIV